MNFRLWFGSLSLMFGIHCSNNILNCSLFFEFQTDCTHDSSLHPPPWLMASHPSVAKFFVDQHNLPHLVMLGSDQEVRFWDVGFSTRTRPNYVETYPISVFVSEQILATPSELLTVDLSGNSYLRTFNAETWQISTQSKRQDTTRIVAAARRLDGTLITIDEHYQVEYWDYLGTRLNQYVLTSGSLYPLQPLEDAVIGFGSGVWLVTRSNGEVRIWDLNSDTPNQLIPEKDVAAIRYIPEKEVLVTMAQTTKIWQLREKTPAILTHTYSLPDASTVTSALYVRPSEAGLAEHRESLILGTNQGNVYIFDWASGLLVTSFQAAKGSIVSLAIGPHGNQFATVSSDPEENVKIWNFPLPHQQELRSDRNIDSRALNIQFSAHGRYLIRQGYSLTTLSTLATWEVADQSLHQMQLPIDSFDYLAGDGMTILHFSFAQIFDIAISDDGTRAFVHFLDGVSLRDVSGVFDVQSTGFQARWLVLDTTSSNMSVDGKQMAVTTYDTVTKRFTTFIFDLDHPGVLRGLFTHVEEFIYLMFSPDGQSLVSSQATNNPMVGKGAFLDVTVYDLRDPTVPIKIPTWRIDDDFLDPINHPILVNVSEDGQFLTLGYFRSNHNLPVISKWDLNSAIPKMLLQVTDHSFTSLSRPLLVISSISNEGAMVGYANLPVRIWSIENNMPTLLPPLQVGDDRTIAAFLSNNHQLWTVDDGMVVTQWDLNAPKPTMELQLR